MIKQMTILELIKSIEEFEGITVKKKLSYEFPLYEFHIFYNNKLFYKIFPTYPQNPRLMSADILNEFNSDEIEMYYQIKNLIREFELNLTYRKDNINYKEFMNENLNKVPEELKNIYKLLLSTVEDYKKKNGTGYIIKDHVKDYVDYVEKELNFLEGLKIR